jgi:hypothetical protein
MADSATTELRYFESLAWFESPEDAEAAAAALAKAGYVFEPTPYVFDESDGVLRTSTVYGVISGHTSAVDEHALFAQLLELTGEFGNCDACGFLDAPTSQAERYRTWNYGPARQPES